MFKGHTSDINALINNNQTVYKVVINTFTGIATGNPSTGSGFVISHYHNTDNVSQWTYHLNGGRYHRQRSNLNVYAWVSDAPIANLTTEIAGSPLDAIMGKQLKGNIETLNSKLNIWANTATWTPDTANMKVGESRPIMCGTAFMGSVIGQTIAGTGTISKTGTDIYSIIIMNCNAAGTLWGLYGIRWNAGVWAYNKFF